MKMQLSLLESDHFVVSCGAKIHESFSLWETKKWFKAVMKGDSVLFICRFGDENRRFRVKFSAPGLSTTSIDACKNFAETVGSLISIKDINLASNLTSDSQMCCDDSQTATQSVKPLLSSMEMDAVVEDNVMSIQDIGKALVTSQGHTLGRAYAETNFPTEQLGAFIRLCLTDSNFPGFVESVERELNSMLEKPNT
eukprot:Em0005g1461a